MPQKLPLEKKYENDDAIKQTSTYTDSLRSINLQGKNESQKGKKIDYTG